MESEWLIWNEGQYSGAHDPEPNCMPCPQVDALIPTVGARTCEGQPQVAAVTPTAGRPCEGAQLPDLLELELDPLQQW